MMEKNTLSKTFLVSSFYLWQNLSKSGNFRKAVPYLTKSALALISNLKNPSALPLRLLPFLAFLHSLPFFVLSLLSFGVESNSQKNPVDSPKTPLLLSLALLALS